MDGKNRPSGIQYYYWLVVKREAATPEALTVGLAEAEYLPVFSFREEALMFLELGDLGNGWELRKIGPGNLLSRLFGDLRGVARVALDPLPTNPEDKMMTELFSVSRKGFMDGLLTLGDRRWVRGKEDEGRIRDKESVTRELPWVCRVRSSPRVFGVWFRDDPPQAHLRTVINMKLVTRKPHVPCRVGNVPNYVDSVKS